MSDQKNENKAPELTNVQQIVQHAVNKEPSQLTTLVQKEIASRVMGRVDARRADVGKRLFGK